MEEPSDTPHGENRIVHYSPSDFKHEKTDVPFLRGWRAKKQHDALLCEGTALTSAIVDYLHGALPTHPSADDDIRGRIQNFILSLVNAGHLVVNYRNDAYDEDPKKTKEEVEDRNQFWHFVCELRRIFSRICRAVNGQIHLKNLEQNPELLEKNTLKELNSLRYKLSSIVIDEARDMRGSFRKEVNKHGSKHKCPAYWYQVALFYEFSIIVRRQQLSGALDACRFARTNLKLRDDFSYGNSFTAAGGVSFNPTLFALDEHAKEAGGEIWTLMKMSEEISLSTQNAAAQGLELESSELLNKLVERMIQFTSNKKNNLTLSSLLHIESTVRVLSNNIIANDSRYNSEDEDGSNKSRFRSKRCEELLSFYNRLMLIVDENQEYDSWLRGLIRAKIKQDGGYLISTILPVFLLDQEYEMPPGDQGQRRQFDKMNLMELYKSGWEDGKDRPVEMRKELRRALINDLIHRSNNFNPATAPGLSKIIALLGTEPTRTNPFTTSTNLVKWLWGEESSNSRHINQFPQSDINKAHISCLLAYLHCLKFHPDSTLDSNGNEVLGGFFSDLESHIDWQDKDEHWRIVSKQKARPQFTIGFFKGVENRKDIITRSKTYGEKNKFNRSNLTRVNKVDALMYLATSINLLEGLLYNQVGRDKMLNRIDRASRTVQMNSSTIENAIHIHDILHLASQAEQNPMRIWAAQIENEKYESTIDQIFRTSFARLYALSRKTEVLAKIIKERPLRQPFQNSAVLIVDQISVLLKFLHTDWLDNEEEFHKQHPSYEMDMSDTKKITQINEFLNDDKRFPVRNYVRHKSADREIFKFRTDVSTEFELSNALSRRSGEESIREVLIKSRERMDFSSSHRGWKEMFEKALVINYDSIRQPNPEELENITRLFNGATFDEKSVLNEFYAVKAMQSLQSESKREWILWARLAFFPQLIDGQIMKSSTLVDSTKSKNVDQSLISHTLRKAFDADFVEFD